MQIFQEFFLNPPKIEEQLFRMMITMIPTNHPIDSDGPIGTKKKPSNSGSASGKTGQKHWDNSTSCMMIEVTSWGSGLLFEVIKNMIKS